MPVQMQDHVLVTPPALDRARQRFSGLAWLAAVYSYLLVVFGGIVRITGSGLGCGDDWPLCNGLILPPWDLATWIEWTHRLLAAGLVVPIGMVVWIALRHRGEAGFSGRGGATRPVLLAVVLLTIQVALGAITVKFDLPAAVTSAHFVNALLLVGALIVASVRARGVDAPALEAAGTRKVARSATAALILGFIVVSFGALTANLGMEGAQTAPSGAAWACQGFPLCNGQFMPRGGDAAGLVHTHWSHRVFAYLLFFHLIGATIAVYRRGASAGIKRAVLASVILVVMQITVAAGMVLHHLPSSMRVMHLILGAALWMALVLWATRARQEAAILDRRGER